MMSEPGNVAAGRKRSTSPWWGNVLLSMAAFALMVALTVAVDRALGALLPSSDTVPPNTPLMDRGFVFPPLSRMRYATPEFNYEISINNLGFRGPNCEPERPEGRIRLALIGDSYTFGWGVPYEQTWGALVERQLADDGLPVDVANLGKPGGAPQLYAHIAERALPQFPADYIAVVFTLGDDVAQEHYGPLLLNRTTAPRRVAGVNAHPAGGLAWLDHPLLHRAYPNILALVHSSLALQTRGTWRREAGKFLYSMTLEEYKRFRQLDPVVQEYFREGLVNPSLILLATSVPHYWELDSEATQAAIVEVATVLQRIRAVAAAGSGARLIALTVPYGVHVSPEAFAHARALGFTLDEDLLTSSVPDETIRLAAARAGVPFASVTDVMRAQHTAGWYFPIDGHMTAAGNAAYAQAIAPVLAEWIAASAEE